MRGISSIGLGLIASLGCSVTYANTMRVATYDAGLSRKGPGLTLDALRKNDPQILAALRVVAKVSPDVILLTGTDFDAGEALLKMLTSRLVEMGADYPYQFTTMPNSGLPTGFDIDGNGRRFEARDAQGFGYFTGDNGMALLSKIPIEAVEDFSLFLWKDLPDSLIGGASLSPEAATVQRLASTNHWDVALKLPSGDRVHLFAFSATPPVFDGPEDRNGRRNHDETAFWMAYLDGELPRKPPAAPFIILGQVNLDPADGEGRKEALTALLSDPRVQDPRPNNTGQHNTEQTKTNGDAMDTAEFGGEAGNLRVDYVLPSRDFTVTGSGVYWPALPDPMAQTVLEASRHRLVYVDVELR